MNAWALAETISFALASLSVVLGWVTYEDATHEVVLCLGLAIYAHLKARETP